MDVLRQVSAVVLVFGLLGLFLWKMRGRGFSGAAFLRRSEQKERRLQSVERLALTPQHTLHLLIIAGREIVVATHPQGCTLLQEATGKGAGA